MKTHYRTKMRVWLASDDPAERLRAETWFEHDRAARRERNRRDVASGRERDRAARRYAAQCAEDTMADEIRGLTAARTIPAWLFIAGGASLFGLLIYRAVSIASEVT